MSWQANREGVHPVVDAVLINGELVVRDTLGEGGGLLGRDVSEFFQLFRLSFGGKEREKLKQITDGGERGLMEGLHHGSYCLAVLPVKIHTEKLWLLVLMRMETSRKELEEIKYDMLANISHELLTPLTVIKTSLELKGIDSLDENSYVAWKGIVRLEKLLMDLLATGEVSWRHEEDVQLRKVFESSLKLVENGLKSKNIQLVRSVERGLPEVRGDRDSFVHLIVLLLGNAIKFTPEGGRVELSAEHEEETRSLGRGMVKVCVKDSGIGVPPSEREKIFDLFYQVDSSATRRYGGTGLGLYLAKNIVDSNGGGIWVDSEPGEGSTFCFTLPASRGIGGRML